MLAPHTWSAAKPEEIALPQITDLQVLEGEMKCGAMEKLC